VDETRAMTAPPPDSATAHPEQEQDELLARVAALGPLIDASADAIERERRLPPALLDAMHAAGLFRLLLPRPFGGAELAPPRFVQVIEAVARHDGSTAWCLCQNSVCAMVAAYLPPEAAQAIFGRDPRAVLAWGPGPAKAIAVAGGYRVTGSWSFASGGRHATWLGGLCPVFEADGTPRRNADGTPFARTMLFPAGQATMTDIWQVVGLKGTASDAFAVTDLFVPEAHAVARDDQAERRYPGRLYNMPTNSLFSCGFACVALGLARSLLDSLVALANEKTPRGYKSRLRDSAVFQSEVAEARLRGARLYILGTLGEVWRALEVTDTLTLDQRMAIRLAATHVILEAVRVADAGYHAAGATAVFERNPFERRFRDIHTVAQQVQGRRSHFETVGRHMFGHEADLTFL
jgi:alkylation response protein AidB-like acyl-CoA dehydrogenase